MIIALQVSASVIRSAVNLPAAPPLGIAIQMPLAVAPGLTFAATT